jgi:hypothetical protein
VSQEKISIVSPEFDEAEMFALQDEIYRTLEKKVGLR